MTDLLEHRISTHMIKHQHDASSQTSCSCTPYRQECSCMIRSISLDSPFRLPSAVGDESCQLGAGLALVLPLSPSCRPYSAPPLVRLPASLPLLASGPCFFGRGQSSVDVACTMAAVNRELLRRVCGCQLGVRLVI